jgi:hypothetical protein
VVEVGQSPNRLCQTATSQPSDRLSRRPSAHAPRCARRPSGRSHARHGPRSRGPPCGGIEIGVEEPEPRWPAARYVELHPGQAGQVTADPPSPELLARDPPVRQVAQHDADGVDHLGTVGSQCPNVIGDGRVEGQPLPPGLAGTAHSSLGLDALWAARRSTSASWSSPNHGLSSPSR